MSKVPSSPHVPMMPGIFLACGGILAVIVMVLHPVAQGADAESRLHSLVAISALSMHVHMAMIGLLIGLWLALTYTVRIWPCSGWVWVASRIYAVGMGAMLGAALISGFVTGTYLHKALPAASTLQDLLPSVLLAFCANQVLAGLGTILMSLAIFLWSIELVRQHDRVARAIGFYGVAAGAGCVGAYAGGMFSLNVVGMTLVVVAHGVWYCLLGGWLIRHSTRNELPSGG